MLKEWDKLETAAAEKGMSKEQFVDWMVQEFGTPMKAAMFVGIYPTSIRYWFIKYGYEVVNKKWVKKEIA